MFRDEMMPVIDFQMEKEKNYQVNMANCELTWKYREEKREQEQEIYEAIMEKLTMSLSSKS